MRSQPSLSFRASYSLRVPQEQLIRAVLSTPRTSIAHKALSQPGHTSHGRLDPWQHLYETIAAGNLEQGDRPLLVVGVRNVLANHRCIAYTARHSPRLQSVLGEDPTLSQRPYHAIAINPQGKLTIDEIDGRGEFGAYSSFCSGVPAVWDSEAHGQLMRRMIAEAADQAHIYHLPRGNHPDANDDTRAAWTTMHNTFMRVLYEPREVAADALLNQAERLGLQREHNYFHAVLGIDGSGGLALHVAHGELEEVGNHLRDTFDLARGICFENSGSISVLFYPEGIRSLRADPSAPQGFALDEPEHSLIAAPNKRRAGTSFLILELADASFDVLQP